MTITNPLHVELLAIGEEFLTGSLVDTNSSYIAEQCNLLGLEVMRFNCVGDNLTQLQNALQEITKRADILIATGGLGPTPDDLTREAAAKSANVVLKLHTNSLTEIEKFFIKLGVTMPESNKVQALFPCGSECLPNPSGTAPGFTLKIGKAECFFTPGVPREMHQMLHEQILPRIKKKFFTQLEEFMLLEIDTFGLSEAIIGEHLKILEKDFPQLKFGTRANFPIIQTKIYARSTNNLEQKQILTQAEVAVKSRIGNWVFADGSRTMQDVVADLLKQEQASFAFLEIENDETEEATSKLAEKMFNSVNATYLLVVNVTPIEKDAGKVHIALAEKNSIQSYSTNLNFRDKESRKTIFTTLALDLLRRKLLRLAVPDKYFGKHLLKNT